MDKEAKTERKDDDDAKKPDEEVNNPAEQPSSQQQGQSSKKEPAVTWTASEYVAHHKGFGWYALLILGAIVLAALVLLATRDIVSTVAIVILAVIFAVAAGFKPRVLTYRLDDSGLTIGKKFYPYGNFKSFTVVQEGAFPSITFMPLKRFMPTISVYFAPDDEKKIVDELSKHLPVNQGKGEAVDRLMNRIRF